METRSIHKWIQRRKQQFRESVLSINCCILFIALSLLFQNLNIDCIKSSNNLECTTESRCCSWKLQREQRHWAYKLWYSTTKRQKCINENIIQEWKSSTTLRKEMHRRLGRSVSTMLHPNNGSNCYKASYNRPEQRSWHKYPWPTWKWLGENPDCKPRKNQKPSKCK